MLTPDQHARLPALLRDIVDHDRHAANLSDAVASVKLAPLALGHTIRRYRKLRAELTEGARHLYGRAPLRGDTGPGRPTAARA